MVVTNNLVRDSIKDIDSVQITYKRENIPNLSVSKVTFWNAGKDTIQKFDIPVRNISIDRWERHRIACAEWLSIHS